MRSGFKFLLALFLGISSGSSILLSAHQAAASPGDIYTVSGTGDGAYSGDGGQSSAAGLKAPAGVAADAAGNIFIADSGSQRIRKVDTSGNIWTLVGTGSAGFSGDGGQAALAKISSPSGICLNPSGEVFFADRDNCRIRKVSALGIISTVAGNGKARYGGDRQSAVRASLKYPEGVASDSLGNLYIADTLNNRVRKVGLTGKITTVAGDGTASYSGDGGQATQAGINNPKSVVVDAMGNIYIADSNNNRVRKVDPSGIITTVAGNGVKGYSGDGGLAVSASLDSPAGVALDSAGNVRIADMGNHAVRMVDQYGTITTAAGTGSPGFSGDGGPAVSARLNSPCGLFVDMYGDIFIADNLNNRVRMLEGGSYPLPLSAITSPLPGSQVLVENLTIEGRASALNGVSFVEVSTDAGATWYTAHGTDPWTFSWLPEAAGTYYIMRRANDSLNARQRIVAYSSATATVSQPVVIPPIAISSLVPTPATATAGATVTWAATASGGTGSYLYQFQRMGPDTGGVYTTVQDYGASNTWTWATTPAMAGSNGITVNVKNADGSGSVATAPAAYTLAAPAVPPDQALLTWTKSTSAGVSGYKVYWGTSIGSYTQSMDAGNVAAYTVTGLSSGTNYFATTSYDSTGKESGYSNEVSKSVVDGTPPTSAVTSPAQGAALTGASYTITGAATDGATGSGVSKVEVSVNGGTSWSTASGTASWSYAWSLPSNGTYTLKSRATDSSGNVETPTASVSVTVSQPVAPSNQAVLTWTPSTSAGVTGYKVHWGTSTGSYTQHLDLGNATTYTFTSLSPGAYYFATTAYDSSGSESGYSNQVSKVIPAQATLTWAASTSSGVSGYKIYYGTTSGSYTNSITVGSVTAYALNGLNGGSTYYFTTAAYDSTGKESGYSNQVSKAIL